MGSSRLGREEKRRRWLAVVEEWRALSVAEEIKRVSRVRLEASAFV
jgi:hypothetical protein